MKINWQRMWPLLIPLCAGLLSWLTLKIIQWNSLPGCGFYRVTGMHCPGCGGTRAARAMKRADFLTALNHNALVSSGAALLALLTAFLIIRITIMGKIDTRLPAISPKWLWAVLVAIATFTVLRNIPAYPFSLLAP